MELIAITKSELINILNEVENGTFINILTETSVRMNKKNNPYYEIGVKKLTYQNVMIGNSYEKRVNNNLEKEEKEKDFVAQQNKVGVHISKCVLFNEKTQKYYLFFEKFDNSVLKTEYSYNGESIEKDKFIEFMPPYKATPSTQNDLEKKVNVQSVTIDNIKEISIGKKRYIIE